MKPEPRNLREIPDMRKSKFKSMYKLDTVQKLEIQRVF